MVQGTPRYCHLGENERGVQRRPHAVRHDDCHQTKGLYTPRLNYGCHSIQCYDEMFLECIN